MPPDDTDTGSAKDSGAAGSTSGDKAPSAEEAAQLLASFKEAGIEDPKGALDTIKKLRSYERGDKLPANVSAELDDLRKQVKNADDAKLSDIERLQKQIADLTNAAKASEDKATALVRDSAVIAAARDAGAIDPDAMPRLIDPSDIEYGKDGQPSNLPKLLAQIKKDRPVWFGSGGGFDGGARRTAEGPPDMETALRSAVGR